MIAIGIDPGTRNLGWGVVKSEGNRLFHLAHGVIRMSSEQSLSSRLLVIEEQLIGFGISGLWQFACFRKLA